ncbi:MAG: TetR/AcrR family transcriptional regulator [Bulleidia sp.]
MSDRYQEILNTALDLFNRHGYENVTMRMISNALGISPGNLTYYFPKKIDILTALLKENRTAPEEEKAESLGDFRRYLLKMVEGVQREQFFFSMSDLQRLDRKFFEENRNAVNHFKEVLFRMLSELQDEGILSEEMSDAWKRDYIEIVMLSHLSWTRETGKESTYTNLSLDEFADSQMRLLEPYVIRK